MPTKRKPGLMRKSKESRPKGSTHNVEALAAEQGVEPVHDPRDLIGDFWPEKESVDEFLAARRRWQQQAPEPKR